MSAGRSGLGPRFLAAHERALASERCTKGQRLPVQAMSWLVCKRTSNIQHCKSWAGPTSRVSSVCSAPPAGRYWNCACEASALAAGAAHYRAIPGPAPQGCGTYLGPRGNKGAFGPSHLCRDPRGSWRAGLREGAPRAGSFWWTQQVVSYFISIDRHPSSCKVNRSVWWRVALPRGSSQY